MVTEGAVVGQINGPAAYAVGDGIFGAPACISAVTRLGDRQLVDIRRETPSGGPVRAQGVLILLSSLAARCSRCQPHAIATSLVFEQTYGPVDGDSAALAELVALLSSIGDAPIRQDLAATASVDQFGNVQAVGAVNEKVDGLFDLCAVRGLSDTQGAVLSASIVPLVMLRDDVVQSVTTGRLSITAVRTVDEALEENACEIRRLRAATGTG